MRRIRQNNKWQWLALAVLSAGLGATTSSAATSELWAKTGTVTMPNGAVVIVWGYATSEGGAPIVPGPRLVVPPGDTTLQITLHNSLTEPTSIVIPGLTAALSPVFVTDAQGRRRVKSFTTETPIGGVQTYSWTVKPGTYLYQSGSMPGKQVTLGLYGAVTNDYAAGEAYAGKSYSNELLIFYSELDPGLAAASDVARPTTYNPRYFLVSGLPYSSSSTPTVVPSSQPTLIRFLNAGLKSHSAQLLGSHMSLIAEDGNAYPYPRVQYAALLAAGKTKDAIWTPPSEGSYSLYDAFHCMTTDGVLGGGLLSRFTVVNPASIPVANPDVYSTNEDTTLAQDAPGVLSNDTPGTLTATLVTGAAHGSITLAANGGFVYQPAPNFNGTDQFTYRAHSSSPSLDSNAATVTITVNPVSDPATAVNDSATTPFNTAVTINVLANDTNPDGLPPSLGAPSNGSVVLNANNTVTYTPNLSFSGTGGFTYMLGTSGPATVTVTVQARVNQPPVAVDDIRSTPRNTAITINVIANDSDPDGTLNPSSVRLAGNLTTITTPQKGTATVNTTTGAIAYTPRNGFRGSDSFTYTVRDNDGALSNVATVTVNVVR